MSAPRDPARPVPGPYKIRLCRGGPWVPARIVCSGGLWQAVIDGEPAGDAHHDWPHADGIDRIWPFGEDISEGEYRYLVALKAWARKHQPDHPCLRPYEPIDRTQLAPFTS